MSETITIIELLNKIANGEIKHCTRFKYNEKIFTYARYDIDKCDTETVVDDNYKKLFSSDYEFNLNDKVELIEEDSIDIQRIEDLDLFDNGTSFNDIRTIIESYDLNFQQINDKIKELNRAVKQLDIEIKELKEEEYCCNCGVELTEENKALHNMCWDCKYGEEKE